MRPKSLLAIALLLAATSCAGLMPRRGLEGDRYTSGNPPLIVKFKKEVRSVNEVNGDFEFLCADDQPVQIFFWGSTTPENTIDYWYPLEKILEQVNARFLGRVTFGGHDWVRFAMVNLQKKLLITGYMTRKDQNLIFVTTCVQLNPDRMQAYERYRQTLQTSQADEAFIQSRFEGLDATVDIIQ